MIRKNSDDYTDTEQSQLASVLDAVALGQLDQQSRISALLHIERVKLRDFGAFRGETNQLANKHGVVIETRAAGDLPRSRGVESK